MPPWGWCRRWGDKGAGRKGAACRARTAVAAMAECPGRAPGGVEPVGTLWMPAGPGWAWGWRGDALCFTGKEFGQACQAGWDNPGRMRWGFAAQQPGLSGLLADPCV